MPTLHNPAEYRLFCLRLGRVIEAHERVSITDAEAGDLETGAIFLVEHEPEPSAEPVRETVKRGSKHAEVTKAPKRETRG